MLPLALIDAWIGLASIHLSYAAQKSAESLCDRDSGVGDGVGRSLS